MASPQQQQPPAGGTNIRSTSLIRSKSLRLPSARRSDHSPSPSNLTRHGSMRLPRSSPSATSIASVASSQNSTGSKKPPPPPIKPKPSFIDRLGEKMHTITNKPSSRTSHETASKAMTLPRSGSTRPDRDHSTTRSVSIDAPISTKEQVNSSTNKEPPSAKNTIAGLDTIQLYRKLTEEHEKLQMEYARLRMQHMDNATSKLLSSSPQCLRKDPNNLHQAYSDTHLDTIPEDAPSSLNKIRFGDEKGNYNEDYVQHLESLVAGYRAEVLRVQEEARKMQRKFWDQVIGNDKTDFKSESGKQVLDLLEKQEERQKELTQLSSKIQEVQSQLAVCNQELQQCHNALQDYQYQIDSGDHDRKVLQQKLRDSQTDLAEARESIEFLQAERSALTESQQEAEHTICTLKKQLEKENDALRELSLRNRKLYSKVQEKNLHLQLLHADLESTQGRARDMLLSQGAELTMGAVAISHLSSRVHSLLSSTLEYAATELGLDKEIHNEINEDFDEVEEDLVGSDFHLSSSSSLDKISKGSAANGKATPGSAESLSPEDPDGPGGKSTSLVQSIIQALEQSAKSEKSTAASSPTSPPSNSLSSLKEKSSSNAETLDSKAKPVGTATAFRSQEDRDKEELSDKKPALSNGVGLAPRTLRDDEASLEGQAKHANAMLNKLLAILNLVQKKYASQVAELESKMQKMELEKKEIEEQKTALENDIGAKTALNDELAGRLSDILKEIGHEKGKQESEVEGLRDQIQELKTQCHSLEAMNLEQGRQMKEEVQKLVKMNNPSNSMVDALAICDKLVLKQEISRLKEVVKEKDDVLKRLAAKFARHKKVWEENYQKAEKEVQKLDEVIEKVIQVLESLPEVVKESEVLIKLLEQLKSGTLYLNCTDSPTKDDGKENCIDTKNIETNGVVAVV